MLSREQFAEAKSGFEVGGVEPLSIPELGGSQVGIRRLSVQELREIHLKSREVGECPAKVFHRVQDLMVVSCLVDQQGNRLLKDTAEDIQLVHSKGHQVFLRIYRAAEKANQTAEESIEAAKKNSSTTQP